MPQRAEDVGSPVLSIFLTQRCESEQRPRRKARNIAAHWTVLRRLPRDLFILLFWPLCRLCIFALNQEGGCPASRSVSPVGIQPPIVAIAIHRTSTAEGREHSENL